MALNLKKGQKIDLVKRGESLGKLLVGLGWDPVKPEKVGFFKAILGGGGQDIDCDASVLMLESSGKLGSGKDVICFSNLKSKCGSVVHTGDNLTGEGDGDDEQIYIDLGKVPERVTKLVFIVNIFGATSRKQHFGMINNCYIRVYDEGNRKELVRYNIDEGNDGKTSLFVATVEREDGGWKFAATGDATNDDSLKTIVNKYK